MTINSKPQAIPAISTGKSTLGGTGRDATKGPPPAISVGIYE
jgi:hypothetical protein